MIRWSFYTTVYVEHPEGYVIWDATPMEFNPALETETNCANTGFWTRDNHACDFGHFEEDIATKSAPFSVGYYAFMDLGAATYCYGSWQAYSVWTDNNDGNIYAQNYDDGHVTVSFR